MSSDPKLSMIVAKSRNDVIGRGGSLPWYLSSDLEFFKKTTMGKPVLMGRKTWESLDCALPGRSNLVLTRDQKFKANGAEIFCDLYNLLGRGYEIAGATGVDEIMIIGGAQLYLIAMEYATRLYVTEVDTMVGSGTHFPTISAHDWKVISKITCPQGPKDDYPYTIRVFERG